MFLLFNIKVLMEVILKKQFVNFVVFIMLCLPSVVFAMDGYFEDDDVPPHYRYSHTPDTLKKMYTKDLFETLTNQEIKEAFRALKCTVTTDARDRPNASSYIVFISYTSASGETKKTHYVERSDEDRPLSYLFPFFQEILDDMGIRQPAF